MEKVYHRNINEKKAKVAKLIPDKVDLRANKITRDREGHLIMTEGSFHQDDVAILNAYAPSNRAVNHVKQKLIEMEGEVDKCTVLVGDFNTSVSIR